MAEQEQGERSLVVSAYGGSPEALEAAALAEARAFFGPEARLEISAGYRSFSYPEAPPERRYHASVTVREAGKP